MNFKKGILTGVIAGGIILGGAVTVSASSTYDSNSIVDHLEQAGVDSSFDNRTKLAEKHDIPSYKGTAKQNVKLLAIAKEEYPAQEAKPKQRVEDQKEIEQTSAVEEQTNYKEMMMEATAYTAFCTGCSGVTYTGQDLRANPSLKVIAVDPTVIPLGSKVHVEGYGEAIAGDIGGDIKGTRIDIFMPIQEDALAWGRRTVKVTILD